jgi:hypothetical protein
VLGDLLDLDQLRADNTRNLVVADVCLIVAPAGNQDVANFQIVRFVPLGFARSLVGGMPSATGNKIGNGLGALVFACTFSSSHWHWCPRMPLGG